MAFTIGQQRALAIIPKCTGLISACLSGIIVAMVLRSQKRRSRTFHRMIAGLSMVDLSTSLWMGLSTWPIPSDSGILFAAGNEATCRLQGFFINMSIASILYNGTLSFYYLLMIRFGWRDRSILRIEPLLHGFPLLWAVGTGIASLVLDAYGNANLWCWVRGDENLLRWTFFYGPLWVSMGVVAINSFITWLHVHKLERAVAKYTFRPKMTASSSYGMNSHLASSGSFHPDDPRAIANAAAAAAAPQPPNARGASGSFASRIGSMIPRRRRSSMKTSEDRRREFKRSRMLARQCFLYAGGFYLNWTAAWLTRLLQIFGKTYFPLLLIATFLSPIQGLPNFLVYLLPEIQKIRKKNPKKSWIKCVSTAVQGSDDGGEVNDRNADDDDDDEDEDYKTGNPNEDHANAAADAAEVGRSTTSDDLDVYNSSTKMMMTNQGQHPEQPLDVVLSQPVEHQQQQQQEPQESGHGDHGDLDEHDSELQERVVRWLVRGNGVHNNNNNKNMNND